MAWNCFAENIGPIASAPQLDDEQRKLIDLANQLCTAIDTGKPRSELLASLDAFIQCAEIRFISEEALMVLWDYNEYAAHREEHKRLLVQIYILEEELATGADHRSELVSEFMKTWTEQHILVADKKFTEFFGAVRIPAMVSTQNRHLFQRPAA